MLAGSWGVEMKQKKIDHKQVYGAGYHAGIRAAGKIDGGYCNAANAILCWNPRSNEVALVPWPDTHGKSDHYMMTSLAVYTHVRESDFEQRKAIVFIEAMHLIVRDGCDPASVHGALLGLDEYRAGCAPDMLLVGIG